MRWLLFSADDDLLGKQCESYLQIAGQTVVRRSNSKSTSLPDVKDQVHQDKPDRIVIVIDHRQTGELVQTITHQLLLPMYVVQATNASYASTPVLILTVETDEPNLRYVQEATDQLVLMFPHVINAQLINPIDDEDLHRDYFKSLWQNDPEALHQIGIVADVLPLLLAIVHDGDARGHVDVCNKGFVSLQWLSRRDAPPIEAEDRTDTFDRWTKSSISPETRQLYQVPFLVPTVSKSLEQIFQQKSIQSHPNAPRILLVTGGCGFIGSTFINFWLETYPNDRIVNIDRLDPVANPKNIVQAHSPNYTLIVADINNKDIVLHLMHQYNITHIVHFAVQAHLDASFGNSITFTESNVYGTHSVLEAGRIYGKIQKFLHISTDEVYGQTPTGSQQEICLLNPLNPYAATIAAAEFLVKSYGESFKLPYCIIRLCNVYGPRQHIEKVIPTFIHALLHDEALKIHGRGDQIRHYLYVDDVIRAIELIFIKGKTKMIYNVGTSNALTVLDIAKALLAKLQPKRTAEEVISYGKPRSFMEQRYYSTTSSILKSLGWSEQVNFDQGLDKTIEWFKANPNYWQHV